MIESMIQAAAPVVSWPWLIGIGGTVFTGGVAWGVVAFRVKNCATKDEVKALGDSIEVVRDDVREIRDILLTRRKS